MNTEHDISFESINGIKPVTSTFADVMRQLGANHKVERVPSRRNKRGLSQPKVVLHFQQVGLAVVFTSQDFTLLPEAPVSIVAAESGCNLTTGDGLHIRMSLPEAKIIIKENYAIRHEVSGCIEITPIDGVSENFIALHHWDNRIEFIGLHRIQTERAVIG